MCLHLHYLILLFHFIHICLCYFIILGTYSFMFFQVISSTFACVILLFWVHVRLCFFVLFHPHLLMLFYYFGYMFIYVFSGHFIHICLCYFIILGTYSFMFCLCYFITLGTYSFMFFRVISSTLACVILLLWAVSSFSTISYMVITSYSQTCLLWPSKGTVNYGYIRQVIT